MAIKFELLDLSDKDVCRDNIPMNAVEDKISQLFQKQYDVKSKDNSPSKTPNFFKSPTLRQPNKKKSSTNKSDSLRSHQQRVRYSQIKLDKSDMYIVLSGQVRVIKIIKFSKNNVLENINSLNLSIPVSDVVQSEQDQAN